MISLDDFKRDYDWRHAFHEAFVGGYGPGPDEHDPIDDVVVIVALSEGVKDEKEWLAITQMRDNTFAVVVAGCDFTGWD